MDKDIKSVFKDIYIKKILLYVINLNVLLRLT